MANNQIYKIDDILFEKIKVHYNNGKSFGELATDFKMSKATIYKSFKKRNEEVRKHNNKYICDENYFNNIDNGNKAYILGFIAADGCLYKHRNCHTLSIGLHLKDREVLEFIKKELQSNSDVVDSLVSEKYHRTLFRVHSSKIVSDLERLGLTERKSLTLTFNGVLIPEIYKFDYLRGYIDGDGHVDSKINLITLLGTEIFCKELQSYLKEKEINSSVRRAVKNKDLHELRILKDSKEKIIKLLNYNSFALSRKKKEMEEILNKIKIYIEC